MKLGGRLRLMLAATFVGIAVLATAVIVPYQRRETRQSISSGRLELRYVAEQIARDAVDLTFHRETFDAVQPFLARVVREDTDVQAAALYDETGALKAVAPLNGAPPSMDARAKAMLEQSKQSIRRETGEGGWHVEYWHPLVNAGHIQGYLFLSHSLAATARQERLVYGGTAALLVGLLLVLFALTGTFLQVNVVQRLARLAGLMQRAVEAELDVHFETRGADEIASIGASFNTMVAGLREREFIKSTFGSYVSPEVVKRMLDGGHQVIDGQLRHATVLFSDIRKFTTISESLQPVEVVALLNSYMERMVGAISARGGRVDKFIGDAIMAEWGGLESMADGERRSVEAAIDMVRALDVMNVDRAKKGLERLGAGIGLNAGQVVAGSIGSARKLEFTVIGDAVNVASRLEGLCPLYGARIVASTSVRNAIGDAFKTRELDHVIVKGKRESTKLYEVLAPEDPRVARLEEYERGMQAYRERRWEDASALFELARKDLADGDAVCAFQITRCVALLAAPPGPEWDGIERREKG
jgi:adenylate cyclase